MNTKEAIEFIKHNVLDSIINRNIDRFNDKIKGVVTLLKQGELNKIYRDAWWKLSKAISDEIEKEEPEECPEYYWLLMSKTFHETFLKAMKEKE